MTTNAKKHTFDGQQLTVAEIMALLPEVTEWQIRNHLARGRNTTRLVRRFIHVPPKPGKRSQLRYGSRVPHSMGGPAPCQPTLPQ